jgi:hypothetical protein
VSGCVSNNQAPVDYLEDYIAQLQRELVHMYQEVGFDVDEAHQILFDRDWKHSSKEKNG